MSSDDIQAYYNQGKEQDRLRGENGLLERFRTQEIIMRYLPEPPVTVLDVGGGAGVYALSLAERGYEVHLRDIVPLHIEQAKQASARQPAHPLASAQLGDALELDFAYASADAVLLLGPLYHLVEQEQRVRALREAYRVLKPSGLLFTAVISRFASMMEGIMRGYLVDSGFAEGVQHVLKDGQHRNPQRTPGYFTTAYFHYPTELKTEVAAAGFEIEAILAVEGPAAFTPNFERIWTDETAREHLLTMLRRIEQDPLILGASGHIIAVGRKME